MSERRNFAMERRETEDTAKEFNKRMAKVPTISTLVMLPKANL